MISYLSRSVNKYTNLICLEWWRSPFPTLLTEQTRRPERVQQIHDKDSHSSTYTCEEFLQNIVIGNRPIEEEESRHPNRRATWIYWSIQDNIVIAEP